jgi:4-diphosphocytidyl-2-C-methyl-D-erythritol kinase
MLEIMQDYAGGIDNDTLSKLGAQIGADVPFFMIGGLAAAAQGIGDELTPIDLELEHSILIVKDPQIFVSTKEAYEGLEIGQAEIHDFTALFETEVSLEEMKAELRNDFEPTVFRRYPRLQQIKQALYDRGAGFALMSGSGSSIYGLFEDASEAIEASLQFESEGLQTFLSNPRG